MRFLLIYFLSFLQVAFSAAQNNNSVLTESFAFEVRTIDDFMERFNFEKNTEFMKYLKENYPQEKITRARLLHSLFNDQNKNLSRGREQAVFVKEMSDSINRSSINFSDSGWYVELECLVSCNYCKEKTQRLFLILKVEEKKSAMKWSVVSAHANFLGNSAVQPDNNRLNDSTRFFLHPMSHALDFMNIDEAFKRKKDFHYYVCSGPHTAQLDCLISQIRKSEIEFIQVSTISYHFLQLKGWIMRVDYFNRYARNSGWLINKLSRVTPKEANDYLLNRLNVLPVN